MPRANSQSDVTSAGASTIPTTTADSSFNVDQAQNFDWFATQNGGTFDPVLFGDYREPQNAIVGDGDFTGGFFNDAMPANLEFGSPFNWADLTAPTGLTPAIQKTNPLDQADAISSGLDNIGEEVVPGENTDQLLTCNKIWYVASKKLYKRGTNNFLGTRFKPAMISKRALSILMGSARNFVPKLAAPRAALSLTSKTSSRLCSVCLLAAQTLARCKIRSRDCYESIDDLL
jgi:hypothetical protein